MHARTNPKLTAFILPVAVTPSTDSDPQPPADAIAAAIAQRFPGTYVEQDDAGAPRVVAPWIAQASATFDSIIANMDAEIAAFRAEFGAAA